MDARIIIHLDDELLAQRVTEFNAELAADGSDHRIGSVEEYVLERLRDVCYDELDLALLTWQELGMSFEVEIATPA